MRDHLRAVQEVIEALASDDYAGVERGVSRIASSDQMGQMCSHMGAGATAFTEQALEFHRTADKILEAARARDPRAVLLELGATLEKCTGCHDTWKQRVVDPATWQALVEARGSKTH